MQEKRGVPGQLPSAFVAFHPSLNSDLTRPTAPDPRLLWDPARLHLHSQLVAGLPGASIAELSFLQRSVDLQAAAYRAQQAQFDLYGAATPPLPGLSSLETARGLTAHDYLSSMSALGQRSLTDYHASGSLVGSDFSLNLEGSRLSLSPRHGRKRPLSSALSDSFDLGSMIRFSPTSLVPLPSVLNGSRCSSASGSYGHLSAGGLSPALGLSHGMAPTHLQQLQAHLLARGSPYLSAQAHSAAAAAAAAAHQHPLLGGAAVPPYTALKLERKEEQPKASPDTSTQDGLVGGGSGSRYMGFGCGGPLLGATTMVKREASSTCAATPERLDEEPPEDFIVTHCDWEDCGIDFESQMELVKHVNNHHISSNKKTFSCHWRDCPREQKPFKAQYMLVVHVRTHTGDKPNKCSFEGCNKRYSRLENLKTHLRSHTGEKPYACEFPGCSKAFSNASDRAKHQNRTHSNEKPYVCKVAGCTKRYTDPSSLRKHVKTVHGPEFYKNKRHKGATGSDEFASAGLDSPGGDDHKVTSMSSPSVKSDDGGLGSPAASGGPAGSPNPSAGGGAAGGAGGGGGGGVSRGGGGGDRPISDNNVSTTNCGTGLQAAWELGVEQELEIPMAGMVGANGYSQSAGYGLSSGRAYRPRMPAKTGLISHGMRGPNVSDLNYRLQHLRMTGGGGGMVGYHQPSARRHSYELPTSAAGVIPPRSGVAGGAIPSGCLASTQHQLALNAQQLQRPVSQTQLHLQHYQQQMTSLADPRRDSAATCSTYYGSMASSRRGSQMSMGGAGPAVAPVAAGFYEPMTDVSRRCSQLSASSGAFSGGDASRRCSQLSAASAGFPAGGPTTAAHLTRRNNQPTSPHLQHVDNNLIVQPQHANLSSGVRVHPGAMPCVSGASGQLRRASDPVYPMDRQQPLQPNMQLPQRHLVGSTARRPSARLRAEGGLHQVSEEDQYPSATADDGDRFEDVLDYLQQTAVDTTSGQPMAAPPTHQHPVGPSSQRHPCQSQSAAMVHSPGYSSQPVHSPGYSSQPVHSPGYSNQPSSYPTQQLTPPAYPYTHPSPSPAQGAYGQVARSPAAAATAPPCHLYGASYAGNQQMAGAAVHTCGHAAAGQPPLQPCPSCQRRQQQWAAGCMPPQAPAQRSDTSPPLYMNSDAYSRTLQYVQRCRQWSPTPSIAQQPTGDFSTAVSDVSVMDSASNVLPAGATNMVVHSMSSAMDALAHENRYLQM